jgi:hypothetical protein
VTSFGRTVGIGAAVLVIALVGGFAYFASGVHSAPADAPAATQPADATKAYTNNTHGFSLQIPADYTVSEQAADSAPIDFISLAAPTGGNIQITITPAPDEGSALTVDSVVQDYPYLANVTTEPFTAAGVTGFSFVDQPNTTNSQNEIWFEYGGELYQFVAYGNANDKLLPIAQSFKLQ